VGEQVCGALKLVGLLKREFGINTGVLGQDGIETLINDKKVLFPVLGDAKVLAGSLKVIFNELDKESSDDRLVGIKEIDLRYDNPILR